MHEYSIVQALYAQVAAHAAEHRAGRVHEVRVRIGSLSGVDPGLLKTAWTTFGVRTMCEGTPMTIDVVTAEWACRSCGEVAAAGGRLRCEGCGGPLQLVRGDEIVLEQIVMEVGDV